MLMMTILAPILIGWFGGMLINYLADTLPRYRQLKPPVCVHCFERQALVNYLLWPKTCPQCLKRRSLRVWIVEIGYILLSVYLWNSPQEDLGYVFSLILFLFFGLVVVIDIEHRLILHSVSVVGAALCLGIGWYLHGLWMTILGGISGFSAMFILHVMGELFMRWLAKRRGETLTEVALGFGDVNLSGVLGLLLGWPGIVAGLLLAVLIGGFVSLVYVLGMVVTRRYHHFAALPYGPFLVASGVFLLFFGYLLR